MILNINLNNNNYIYHYELKKGKLEEKYAFYVYRTSFIKSEKRDIFSILKDFITEKKDIDAEFFINKINKVSRCELLPMNSFEQSSKKIVSAINLHENITNRSSYPSKLSILYLNGKTMPKINNICIIDNNMYFIIKYKNEYIMYDATYENMECIIPLSNIFKLYKRLKNVNKKFCLSNSRSMIKPNLTKFTLQDIPRRPKSLIRNTEAAVGYQPPTSTQSLETFDMTNRNSEEPMLDQPDRPTETDAFTAGVVDRISEYVSENNITSTNPLNPSTPYRILEEYVIRSNTGDRINFQSDDSF